jgi:integrase/recombinase XerD
VSELCRKISRTPIIMETGKATTKIFLDKYHPKKDGKCKVSICVTFERKKKYYPTPIEATPSDFDKCMGSKPRKDLKELSLKMQAFEQKAASIIKDLHFFSWSDFESNYLRDRSSMEYIYQAFTDYANNLRREDRIGTAVSYECARNSINKFSSNCKFSDISVDFLKRYEKWMLDQNSSITSVGIYLRSLRTLFNAYDVPQELYPFGKRKYEIPTGKNKKKSLSIQDIGKIYNHSCPKGSSLEMAKDLWVFMYLSNGINVKDLCLLKYGNIKGDVLEFLRAKTIRTKRQVESIRIPLSEQAKAIINKWGNKKEGPETYIFPILEKGLSVERERELIQLITKLINKKMKRIAEELGLDSEVTTYAARHSFATILQRSGASISFISESLGHGSLKTTQSYLAGFEDETKKEVLKALLHFD